MTKSVRSIHEEALCAPGFSENFKNPYKQISCVIECTFYKTKNRLAKLIVFESFLIKHMVIAMVCNVKYSDIDVSEHNEVRKMVAL